MCSVLSAHRPMDSNLSPPANHASSMSSSSDEGTSSDDSWSPFHVLCAVAATGATTDPDRGSQDMKDSTPQQTAASAPVSGTHTVTTNPTSSRTSVPVPNTTTMTTTATSRKKRILERCVSKAGSGTRQQEEALAASALLDLASMSADATTTTPVIKQEASPLSEAPAAVHPPVHVRVNNQTSVITSNPNVLTSASSRMHRRPHHHHHHQPLSCDPAFRPSVPKSEAASLVKQEEEFSSAIGSTRDRLDFLFPAPSDTNHHHHQTQDRRDCCQDVAPLPASSTPSSPPSLSPSYPASDDREDGSREYAVIDLSTKSKRIKLLPREDQEIGVRITSAGLVNENKSHVLLPPTDGNNNTTSDSRHLIMSMMSGAVDQENRQSGSHHLMLDHQRIGSSSSSSFLPPNVMHFLPSSTGVHAEPMMSVGNSNHHNNTTMAGMTNSNSGIRRSLCSTSSSSSCSSSLDMDGSESCCSSQVTTGLVTGRKRGRKPRPSLHDMDSSVSRHGDEDEDHPVNHEQSGHSNNGQFSNPIKEFRQRQRLRERQEDERLSQLEARYKNAQLLSSMALIPGHDVQQQPSLEEVYDAHGMNMKFPRVKTALKRGKAADDSERTNRKKECARRDSKNYRERAKAKRDLVLKKIGFLEDLFKSAAAQSQMSHKFQYASFA